MNSKPSNLATKLNEPLFVGYSSTGRTPLTSPVLLLNTAASSALSSSHLFECYLPRVLAEGQCVSDGVGSVVKAGYF